jgi:transmembrane 9 superfamily member 3
LPFFCLSASKPSAASQSKKKKQSNTKNKKTTAVSRRYWYELFVDDLPVWGFVGPPPSPANENDPPRVFTHQAFTIAVNGPHVVGVNLTTEAPSPVLPGASLAFTYSVDWVESAVPYARRFDTYLDSAFFEHKVHAFSLLNSTLLVVVLLGLTAGVLVKTLRADFRRYEGIGGGKGGGPDDLEALDRDLAAGGAGLLEETGWKAVHGDVFRTPPSLALLSAAAGTGAQLAALAGLTVAAAAAGELFTDRGAVTSVAIAAYALTAALGGYVSGSHYSAHGGRRWVRVALFTACLFPGVVGCIGLILNAIAIAYRSLAAVSFLAAAAVGAVWLLCAAPLSLLGTLVGRRLGGAPDAPCRVKRVPSPIPAAPWFLTRPALIIGAGALPFGAIFIEIFFLFSALWSYKVRFEENKKMEKGEV